MSVDIHISEEAGVRYLHFSSDWVQGAMRIARPWALELDYTREMMAALLLRPDADWPRSALLIGLGAGSLTKFLHRHRPATRITVVETEPAVVAAACQYFKLPAEDARFSIVIAEGAEFVAGTKKRYDLILVDGYDEDARTGMLDTAPFYAAARARLSAEGLLVTNLLSKRRDFRHSVERLRDAFDGRALAFPSCDSGNAVAFAASGEALRLPLEELKENALALKRDTGLNLLPTVTKLARSKACPGDVLSL
ncbi:MAG: fused MFS/spermidine synthase [Gammaproteobacteria bacterium]|nr:fused MFS/spermidine synthase [Gammaproteobacteria bacterium]MBU1646528.1 fused MFS/spermidine synthase [Gammaproteobacteria bacterium]MBU1973715.1 fused MFS/spermidine synthase [Gammaproteobacteria bacterium]